MARAHPKSAILPITTWQHYILEEATHPECTDDLRDRLILANAFLVQPGIDIRRLRRAVDKLRERHDSLRIRFDRIKGSWRAVIDPPGGDTITQIDLGDLDDAAFLPKISALANASMPLINAPLAEIIIAHCGARGDVLITRVHHAITDGYGMVVLTEDLTKLLIGMPILGPAISHADYIARFQSPPPSRAAEIAAFWDEMHRDFPQAPNVGRKAKGVKPLDRGVGKVDPKRLIYTATPQSLAQLDHHAAASNNSTATTLFAGFLETMCDSYDLDKIVFMASMARTDPAMDSYIGDHTLDPVLPYQPGGRAGFEGAIKTLNDTLIQCLAHLPSDAARRATPYETALIENGAYPRQFSIHQPRAITRQNRSIFREGFYIGYGQEQQIGPYTLTSIDVTVLRRRWSEMYFDVGASKVRSGFQLHYDGFAFSEAETRRLGDSICDLLALDSTDVVLK